MDIRKFLKIQPDDTPPYCGAYKIKRSDLIEIFKRSGFKIGAEIGVNKGNHSEMMCQMMPDLELTCVDPWKDYIKRNDPQTQEKCYQEAKEKLSKYNVTIIRDTSLNAVKLFPDNYFDFVYIDGNHTFDDCIMDLVFWSQKVRSGGMVAGHDYVQRYQFGVIEAVNAYTRAHNINDWYLLKGREPTFFWVKK
jgi:predicted O-methyltransferase YrrM